MDGCEETDLSSPPLSDVTSSPESRATSGRASAITSPRVTRSYDEAVKVGYLRCRARPYVPNPLRCFKCQRFGHGSRNCRGSDTCAKCSSQEHVTGSGRVPHSTYDASSQAPSRRSSSLFWTTPGTSEQQTVRFPVHPPGSGDAAFSATDEQQTTETVSLETSTGRHSEASWWLLPVVVLGVCSGLVLLAVAALGTTYTYRIVVSHIGADEKLSGPPRVDGGMTYPTGPDGEAMVLLPGDSEEDGDDEEGERGSDDGGPRPAARLWCFVRSLKGVAPAARGTPAASPLPRGLCSAVVYQGIQVTWQDSQASLVVSSLASGDLERLASLRDFEPLLELHVHAVSANVTKGSTGGSGRHPSAALRSLLRAPQGTVEGFAMRSARWLADRHVDGLVLELGRSVQALPTELITRLAELCHRQLGRVGKSFTLLLPGSTSLFVQYDLDALLITRGLHPILRTDADGARPVATCPSPLNAPDFGIERVLNRTRAALGARRQRQGLSRLLFSLSLAAAQYTLDSEPKDNATAAFSPASFRGYITYPEMCKLVLSGGWKARPNLDTDCAEAFLGKQWVSSFAPFSGDWLLSLKGTLRGLAVFDAEADDVDGVCGEKHALLKRLRDLIS